MIRKSPHPSIQTEATPFDLQQDLLRMIGEGRILEAFHRFYADDVIMQENEATPCVGFVDNLAREHAFVASIAFLQEVTVLACAAAGEHTFYECVMRWTGIDGRKHRLRQVSIARWSAGRIVEERFVYDSAA